MATLSMESFAGSLEEDSSLPSGGAWALPGSSSAWHDDAHAARGGEEDFFLQDVNEIVAHLHRDRQRCRRNGDREMPLRIGGDPPLDLPGDRRNVHVGTSQGRE